MRKKASFALLLWSSLMIMPVPTDAAPAETESVWVAKSNGAKSCAQTPIEKGIPLDKMASELTGQGIKVLAKKKIPDGRMRIQSCGADKGDMNGYLISRKDVEKAKELGFDLAKGSN